VIFARGDEDIAPHIDHFRSRGGRTEVVFGVYQLGTSIQALRIALAHFDRSYVWHHPSPFTTFHPKLYIFEGGETGEISVRSNNLTVGGLKTNCEAGVSQLTTCSMKGRRGIRPSS